MRDYYMRAAIDSSGDAQATVAGLKPGDQLKFIREPNNPDDKYAVRIETMTGQRVGYVSRIYSQRISVTMTHGFKYKILVDSVSKGRLGGKNYELDMRVLYTVPDLSKIPRRKKKQ